MSTIRFGLAAPAPEVRQRFVTAADLERLFEVGLTVNRSYALEFRGPKTLIQIIDIETRASRTLELPAMIRGRFVADLEMFIALETERPHTPEEL